MKKSSYHERYDRFSLGQTVHASVPLLARQQNPGVRSALSVKLVAVHYVELVLDR